MDEGEAIGHEYRFGFLAGAANFAGTCFRMPREELEGDVTPEVRNLPELLSYRRKG